MRDRPEEIGDIGIDDPSPTLLHLTPDPAHSHMRRPLRTKPEADLGERVGSKIGSRTWRSACWHTRSTTAGMPSGRLAVDPGLSISTRRTGKGR
jgi:hypothetical protein